MESVLLPGSVPGLASVVEISSGVILPGGSGHSTRDRLGPEIHGPRALEPLIRTIDFLSV